MCICIDRSCNDGTTFVIILPVGGGIREGEVGYVRRVVGTTRVTCFSNAEWLGVKDTQVTFRVLVV